MTVKFIHIPHALDSITAPPPPLTGMYLGVVSYRFTNTYCRLIAPSLVSTWPHCGLQVVVGGWSHLNVLGGDLATFQFNGHLHKTSARTNAEIVLNWTDCRPIEAHGRGVWQRWYRFSVANKYFGQSYLPVCRTLGHVIYTYCCRRYSMSCRAKMKHAIMSMDFVILRRSPLNWTNWRSASRRHLEEPLS